jgi:hypothetical protein
MKQRKLFCSAGLSLAFAASASASVKLDCRVGSPGDLSSPRVQKLSSDLGLQVGAVVTLLDAGDDRPSAVIGNRSFQQKVEMVGGIQSVVGNRISRTEGRGNDPTEITYLIFSEYDMGPLYTVETWENSVGTREGRLWAIEGSMVADSTVKLALLQCQ